MSSKADGGPAFPVPGVANEASLTESTPGMTLRDWFAGMALQGFIANPSIDNGWEVCVPLSYEWADAMLKERQK